MPELITIGETMAVVVPKETGKLRYINEYEMKIAGAESNLAIGLQKLGHSTGFISSLGDDEMGIKVLQAIRAEGVDTGHVSKKPEYRTGLMIKEILSGKETRVYYYRDHSAASNMKYTDMPQAYLSSCQIIHITGILPMLSDSCLELTDWILDFAKDNNIKLSFDPNIRKKLWKEKVHKDILKKCLLHSNIILTSLEEAKILLGTDDIDRIFTILLEEGHAEKIAIKDGAKGAYVADQWERHRIMPFPCQVIDPIGAGDAFNSAFLCGILEGKEIEICGKMGGLSGALAVQNRGDIEGLPERAELDNDRYTKEEIYR